MESKDFPFSSPNQFRLLKEEYASLNFARETLLTCFNVSVSEGRAGAVSFLVYDPPIFNGRLIQPRTYSCSFVQKHAEQVMDYIATQRGMLNPEEYTGFLRALNQGKGELNVSERTASSLLLEEIANSLPYVHNDSYSTSEVRAKVMAGVPEEFKRFCFVHQEIPSGEPSDFIGNTLTREQEQQIFQIYNGVKFYLKQEIYQMAHDKPSAQRRIRKLEAIISESREIITHANMPLVLAMARRTRLRNIEFSELISEGNFALSRAIEKFDAARGFKFSSYACPAILKSFSRDSTLERRYRQIFPVSFDPEMEKSNNPELVRAQKETFYLRELKEQLAGRVDFLDEREEFVVRHHYGIGVDKELAPETLEEVGKKLGVTRERVRQIEDNALKKLKRALMSREEEESRF